MDHSIDITMYKALPKHELLSISFNKYSIKTIVTSCPSVVKKWLSATEFIHRRHLNTLVVGLGVQWKPFSTRHRNRAATLQLCVGRRCLIFQIRHADYIPKPLNDFLQNTNYSFVGVWNSLDASMLANYGLEVNLTDIRSIAAEKYHSRFRSMSMARMVYEILGMKGVDKSYWVGKSNWDAYILSLKQIKYASLDAFVSFMLGKHLEAWEDHYEDIGEDDGYSSY